MNDEFLKRTRISGTDFYKDQHNQTWKKVAGIYKKTDETPYAKTKIKPAIDTPTVAVKNPADSLNIQLISGAIVFVILAVIVFGYKSCSNSANKPLTPQQKQNQKKVDAAYRICDVISASGLVHECEVSGFYKKVSFRVDANSIESKAICNQVANMAGNYVFRKTWGIEVYSPFSGDHIVASCVL